MAPPIGRWLNSVANFQSKFGFFLCYSLLPAWYVRRFGPMSKATNLLVGYVAKLLPLPLVYPSSVLTNRMQVTGSSPPFPQPSLPFAFLLARPTSRH